MLGPSLFLLYINGLPDDVICDIAIYADDTTLYFKCDQTTDLWKQSRMNTISKTIIINNSIKTIKFSLYLIVYQAIAT